MTKKDQTPPGGSGGFGQRPGFSGFFFATFPKGLNTTFAPAPSCLQGLRACLGLCQQDSGDADRPIWDSKCDLNVTNLALH